MKLAHFLMATGFLLGLVNTGIRATHLSPKRQENLITQFILHAIAASKSSELAMEKAASSYLRDTATKFHNELRLELDTLLQPSDATAEQIEGFQRRADQFQFQYEYNEAAPFDNEFIRHESAQCEEALAILKQLGRAADKSVIEAASRYHRIFSRYHSAMVHFEKNFLALDEHRIRDFAHQIWESEGRPEGQATRHWAMAVELSKKLTAAELQLAFEQKRSAVELLSTTKFDKGSPQETIH